MGRWRGRAVASMRTPLYEFLGAPEDSPTNSPPCRLDPALGASSRPSTSVP